MADQAISEAEVNWLDLAEKQRIKRFGEGYPDVLKGRLKQIRFLTMRGFPSHIVREITQAFSIALITKVISFFQLI